MTTDLATTTPGGPLAGFDPTVVDIVRRIVAPDLTDDTALAFFLSDCKRRGLDPLARQAYAFRDKGGRIVTIIGIDGFRAIAEGTGQYRGRAFTEYDYGNGWTDRLGDTASLIAARVGVLRAGYDAPVVANALLREHAQRSEPWRRMTHLMLAKCAEAQALRAAFPHALSGAYTQEEIEHAPPVPTTDVDARVVADDERDEAMLGRLRVLGSTVSAIHARMGNEVVYPSEVDVYDRIVRPKAASRGVPADGALVVELVAEAEERLAMMTENE